MHNVAVANFEDWRSRARDLLAAGIDPSQVCFTEQSGPSLFANFTAGSPEETSVLPTFPVPRRFLAMAETAALHRDPKRWNLLYRCLYRIARLGERQLLDLEVDPDVRELSLMEKAVDRDIHKMHAFVRFRKVADTEQYVAWHRPDHHILEHVGPWFARRFGAMQWAILTPDRSAYWDKQQLRFGPGVPRSEAPDGDVLEDLWRSYYSSIFNPARANLDATKKEMPVRYWATLPEAQLIPKLLLEASGREGNMRNVKRPSAEPFVPEKHTLPILKEAINDCRGCELYKHATQAVFGEGHTKSRLMFVGEQPGDHEDLQGRPFVGPAGMLWNKALAEAEIDRSEAYVTNAVKHFKFEERGKRRIHKKPSGIEVAACRPWLTAEIEQVDPRIIIALGATAALSVGGREFGIQKERGKLMPIAGDRQLLVTVHPSFLLRIPDADRDAEFARFVADLRLVA